jgi:hypothetical protein
MNKCISTPISIKQNYIFTYNMQVTPCKTFQKWPVIFGAGSNFCITTNTSILT